MKKKSRSNRRQREAMELVRPKKTSARPISKVAEIYNATNGIMEITDEKGRACITLQPYERREITETKRIDLEKLEHFTALKNRKLVRFF